MVALHSKVNNHIKPNMSKQEEAEQLRELILAVLNSEDNSSEEQEALRNLFDGIAKSSRFKNEVKNKHDAFMEALSDLTAAGIKKKFEKTTKNLDDAFVRHVSTRINNKEVNLYNSEVKLAKFSLDVPLPNDDSDKQSTHLDGVEDSIDKQNYDQDNQRNKIIEILFRYPIAKLKNIYMPNSPHCNLQEVMYRKELKLNFNPKTGKYKRETFQEIEKNLQINYIHNWYNPRRKKTRPKEEGEKYVINLRKILKQNENQLTEDILDQIAEQEEELKNCYLEGYPKINASSIAKYCLFNAPEAQVVEIVKYFIRPYEQLSPEPMITFLEEKCFPKLGEIIHQNLPDDLK
jgi:hypothetical protein